MRFLCLVHIDKTLIGAISQDEDSQLRHDSVVYDQLLESRGVYIAANALAEPDSATFVSVRAGQRSRTDGPFAETREHLGGFILIDVPDLEAAIEVAGNIPIAKYGRIEVRAIMEFSDPLA